MMCGICGAAAPKPFHATPAEQSPDLDLRPGEPTRSSLPHWVQTCRRCAAAAPDLSRLTPDAPIGSNEYLALQDRPPGTLVFRRWALLCPRSERPEALLWAAWAADDAGDEAAARLLRQSVVSVWPDDGSARRIDVLRRAGLLEQAAAACAAIDPDDPVMDFQRALIAAGDVRRHQLSSALRPPARTPHVAHGRQSGGRSASGLPFGTLWSRLLGR